MAHSNSFLKKTQTIAKTVVQKTQDLIEYSQLSLKIMKVKNKIERKYLKIGYCLYNKQRKDGIEKLKAELENEKFIGICKDIDYLYKELKNLKCECEDLKRNVKKDCNCLLNCEKTSEKVSAQAEEVPQESKKLENGISNEEAKDVNKVSKSEELTSKDSDANSSFNSNTYGEYGHVSGDLEKY